MPVSPAQNRLVGLLLLAMAFGFLCWATIRRVERVNAVTAIDASGATADTNSPTGYADARRWLIVPEHHTPSYERIAETQQMFATGSWRVRHVDYENAPEGRPVYSSSAYRWWLAGLAWIHRAASGDAIGMSVERVAVWSEPLLHLALLLVGTGFVARWFGPGGALWFALGTVFLFPLGASFLPAVPNDGSLARLCVLAAVLPLLAALRPIESEPGGRAERHRRRLFLAAGIAGGLGLWIEASHHVWIIIGTVVGAVLGTLIVGRPRPGRDEPATATLPWRVWAWAGALTGLFAYVLEYAPAHLALRLEVNHPLYAVAWIGFGEVLMLVQSYARQRRGFWRIKHVLVLVLALAATASLPIALILLRPQQWFSGDLFASRLTNLPNAVSASNFGAWLSRDGLSGALMATVAPLVLLVPAVRLLFQREAETWRRFSASLLLGLLAVVLPFAVMQLEWWSTVDALLLALGVALLASRTGAREKPLAWSAWLRPAFAAVVIGLGFLQLRPTQASGQTVALTPLEVEALVERAAAHWIVQRAGPEGAVVLLPPHRTMRWCFHGGPRLRGLGSAAWENRDGLAGTIRIVTAQTGEEVQALLQERGVTHLILPSWDEDLQRFARLALTDPNDAFIMAVHKWSLPPWLRPLPYPLPVVPGLEGESIVVLQVTDQTNRAAAWARMLEYFLETNQAALADAAGEALRRFPADANALVGLAQLQKARDRTTDFEATLESVLAGVNGGFDRGMPWDRRVSLAIVLAQGEQHDLAREQVERCLDRLDANRILTLTTGALYRLQVLARAYGLTIADPALRQRARELLPAPLQERLAP